MTTADQNSDRRYLPISRTCFVCGHENPMGLALRFFVEDGTVRGRWKPRPEHCGLDNVLHGGVIASGLDECMAWAATRFFGRICVTGELRIRYLAPAPGAGELNLKAWIAEPGKRIAQVEGLLHGDTGVEYARGFAKFVPLSAEETLRVDDALLYDGASERPFDYLRNPDGESA